MLPMSPMPHANSARAGRGSQRHHAPGPRPVAEGTCDWYCRLSHCCGMVAAGAARDGEHQWLFFFFFLERGERAEGVPNGELATTGFRLDPGRADVCSRTVNGHITARRPPCILCPPCHTPTLPEHGGGLKDTTLPAQDPSQKVPATGTAGLTHSECRPANPAAALRQPLPHPVD